jgi:hypothetical protein
MVRSYGYSLLSLGNSVQDLVRRGLPVADVAGSVVQLLADTTGDWAREDLGLGQLLRPAPDILRAFAGRVAALGAVPAVPVRSEPIHYPSMLEEALPKKRGRAREEEPEPDAEE